MPEKSAKKLPKDSLLLQELDESACIAHHYGFIPIITPKITTDDKTKGKTLKTTESHPGETEEQIAVMRLFQEGAFARTPQPPMVYFKKPFVGSDVRKKPNTEMCGLEAVGANKSTAEALIIKTAWTILTESGATDMRVEINSMGDKESFVRFERDLHIYFRKHIHTLSGEMRQKFKENNLDILSTEEGKTEDDNEFIRNAPKPMACLSEPSRVHFKEVLEFLETTGIPYQIQPGLIGNKQYHSHTIFEIKGKASKTVPETTLAYGERYNYLAKKIGFKKDVQSCGATLFIPKQNTQKTKKNILLEKMKHPRLYIVQLGTLAKLQTLNIIELLREENIPVYHALTKENIGGQLQAAEYLQVSHLLIIGQKEALEKSVVVRSTDLRVQETVNVCDLCEYLKSILKGN